MADSLLRIYSHSRQRLGPQINAADPNLYHTFFTDFDTFIADDWAAIVDGTPALGIIDAAGGVLQIATGVTNEDEHYVSSIAESWLFAADKPLWFEARVALTEAATDKADLIVGLSDTVAADTLQNAGAGPPASYDGAVWYKVEGSMLWRFETSNAGAQVTNASVGAFVSNTWYRVGFVFNPLTSTTGTITPYLNGVGAAAHAVTLTGMAEMHVLMGVKNGVGTTAETLRVDYVKIIQKR